MLRVLTPVFPPHINPVRDGWYLHRYYDTSGFVLREYLNGEWRFHDGEPLGSGDTTCWCGLAFDPASAEDCQEYSFNADPVSVGVFLPGATCC